MAAGSKLLFDSSVLPTLQKLSGSTVLVLRAAVFITLALSPPLFQVYLGKAIPVRQHRAAIPLLLAGIAYFSRWRQSESDATKPAASSGGTTASLPAWLVELLSALQDLSKPLGTYFTVSFFVALAWASPFRTNEQLPFQAWVYCLLLLVGVFAGFLAPTSKFYGPLRFGYLEYGHDVVRTYRILLTWWVYAAYFPVFYPFLFTCLTVGLVLMTAAAWFTVYHAYRAQVADIAEQAATAVARAARDEACAKACELAARGYEATMLDVLVGARRDMVRLQGVAGADFFDTAATAWAALGRVTESAKEVTVRAHAVVSAAIDVKDTEKPGDDDDEDGGGRGGRGRGLDDLVEFLIGRANDALAQAEGAARQLQVAQEAVLQSEDARKQRRAAREAAASHARSAAKAAASLADKVSGWPETLCAAAEWVDRVRILAERANGAAVEGEMAAARASIANAMEPIAKVSEVKMNMSKAMVSARSALLGFL